MLGQLAVNNGDGILPQVPRGYKKSPGYKISYKLVMPHVTLKFRGQGRGRFPSKEPGRILYVKGEGIATTQLYTFAFDTKYFYFKDGQHLQCPRRDQPFIRRDCPSIKERVDRLKSIIRSEYRFHAPDKSCPFYRGLRWKIYDLTYN